MNYSIVQLFKVCIILQIRPKTEILPHFGQSWICKIGQFSARDGAEIRYSTNKWPISIF